PRPALSVGEGHDPAQCSLVLGGHVPHLRLSAVSRAAGAPTVHATMRCGSATIAVRITAMRHRGTAPRAHSDPRSRPAVVPAIVRAVVTTRVPIRPGISVPIGYCSTT